MLDTSCNRREDEIEFMYSPMTTSSSLNVLHFDKKFRNFTNTQGKNKTDTVWTRQELRKFQSIAIIIRSLFFSYVCIIVRSSSALWTVEPWWSLRLGYSYLDKDKPDNLSVLYIIMSNLYSSTTGRVVCSEDINTAKQTNPVKNSQHRINGYV